MSTTKVSIPGEVYAQDGVRVTTATSGPIVIGGANDPNGATSATIGSLYMRTGTAELFQNTDGATAWAQIGAGGGSGSLSIASAAQPANVDLTAEGTIDWFAMLNATATGANSNTYGVNIETKLSGGAVIKNGFFMGFGSQPWIADNSFQGTIVSASAGDSTGNGSFPATNIKGQWIYSSGDLKDWGWCFRVPAAVTQRVLRIYSGVQASKLEVNAVLSDNSAPAVQTFLDSAGTGQANSMITVTYTAAPGIDLIVTAKAVAAYAGAANHCYMGVATLGIV